MILYPRTMTFLNSLSRPVTVTGRPKNYTAGAGVITNQLRLNSGNDRVDYTVQKENKSKGNGADYTVQNANKSSSDGTQYTRATPNATDDSEKADYSRSWEDNTSGKSQDDYTQSWNDNTSNKDQDDYSKGWADNTSGKNQDNYTKGWDNKSSDREQKPYTQGWQDSVSAGTSYTSERNWQTSKITIYRYDKKTSFVIPITPEEIKVKTQTRFISYDVMSKGAVSIPLGDELIGFSWSSFFPGEKNKNHAFMMADKWTPPAEIQGDLSVIREKGVKCKLWVGGTPICHEVYLKNYDVTYKGGYGDYYYNIEWVVARDLTVSVTTKSSSSSSSSSTSSSGGAKTKERQNQTINTMYVVKTGDSLWSIAEKQLGSGTRWEEIKKLNIEKYNPETGFLPGTTIKLPTELKVSKGSGNSVSGNVKQVTK